MCIRDRFSIEDISTAREVLFKMDLEIKYPDNSILSDSAGIALLEGLTTVSYTHLDVYKRQLILDTVLKNI